MPEVERRHDWGREMEAVCAEVGAQGVTDGRGGQPMVHHLSRDESANGPVSL